MTISEFREKFIQLKSRGFVRSHRKGSTGVGHTLEQELGLKENNIAVPDVGFAELKAHRDRHTRLITLFTFNRKAWQMKPLPAIRRYGTVDDKGRCVLYSTTSKIPNSLGLYLDVKGSSLEVLHKDGQVILKYPLLEVARRFQSKIPSLILVSAQCEFRNEHEYFYFYRARLLQGGANLTNLINAFTAGYFVIDLRLHEKNANLRPAARNHGTGFRVQQNHLVHLFERVKDI